MGMFEWVISIFTLLRIIFFMMFFLAAIGRLYEYVKTEKKKKKEFSRNPEEQRTAVSKWQDVMQSIYAWIITIFVEVVFIYLYSKIKRPTILMLLAIFPILAKMLTEAYSEISVVENVIRVGERGKMSLIEKKAIFRIAFLAYVFDCFDIFGKLVTGTVNIKAGVAHDFAIFIMILGGLLFYLFLITFLMPQVTELICGVLGWIYRKVPGKGLISKFHSWWNDKILSPRKSSSILVWEWVNIKKWVFPLSLIRIVIAPIAFVLDLLKNVIVLIWTLVALTIGYVVIFIRILTVSIMKIFEKIAGLSDKRMVGIFIRIVPMIALLVIVILNRYVGIFTAHEESTEILEFVASAIIIPIVFEWIYSVKINKEKSPETPQMH